MISPVKIQENINGALQDLVTVSDIVDYGSNANGYYVRFADGTQICRSTITLTGIDVAENDAIWQTNQYTSPAQFTGAYMVIVGNANAKNSSSNLDIILGTSYCRQYISLWNTGRSPSNYLPGNAIRGRGSTSYNINSAIIQVVAIGKWK